MKVLQINSVCGIGSTGRIATDIHQILVDQGHESYIAFGRDEPMNCDTAIRIGNKLDNYKHVAKTRLLDLHGFGSKNATLKFIEKIKEINPDVIHLHNIHGYYVNIEVLFNYLKKANKPVVWTLHDCWAFTGHCSYFDYSGCEKWKTQCHTCPQQKEYPSSMLKDNSKQNFQTKKELFTGIENLTVVTPSNWLANLVKESFLGEYPVKVINNGIDLNIFQPTESDFRERNGIVNKFILLGVASTWDRRKGFEYFIKMSDQLKDDEVIVLVGLSEEQVEILPRNIIGITRTNNIKELAEIYSAADVFVNSTLEEVMGLTNVEALACGTPVITFDTGGSVECVDEKCGYVVAKGSTNEVIQKIVEVKRKGKYHYSVVAINRANKLYDKNEKYNEYLVAYGEHMESYK